MRSLPIHSSLTRPILFAGGERALVFSNYLAASVLILGVGGLFATGFGIVLAIVGHSFLVRLAKKDPIFSKIFIRHFHQQSYYPARAHISAPVHVIRYSRQ